MMTPAFYLRSTLVFILMMAIVLLAEVSPARETTRGLAAGISLLALTGLLLVGERASIGRPAAEPAGGGGIPDHLETTVTEAKTKAFADLKAGSDNGPLAAAMAEEAYDEETIRTVERYLKLFYYRYKGFYGDIQRIPIPASEAQTQAIRQQLVEMGIHALSFARAFRLAKLTRLNDEPNIRMILEQLDIGHLETSAYRRYTDDPYKTEKRYHILRKVFQEMNLDHLDVLLETVYISPEFLKKP